MRQQLNSQPVGPRGAVRGRALREKRMAYFVDACDQGEHARAALSQGRLLLCDGLASLAYAFWQPGRCV